MTKIILNGANGAMGKVVSELIALDPTVEIVAGVEALLLGRTLFH